MELENLRFGKKHLRVYVCSFLIIYLILNYIQAGKKAAILGVLDSKLSAAINEATEIKCSHIGVIPEVGLTNTRLQRSNAHISESSQR